LKVRQLAIRKDILRLKSNTASGVTVPRRRLDLREYLPFATPREAECIEAILAHDTKQEAATALGITARNLRKNMAALKTRAAKQGFSPDHDMTHTVPEGFGVKGVSTLYGPEGDVKAQWVKSSADTRAQEMAREAALQALSESLPREKAVTTPKSVSDDLLNCFIITDYHFGMLAWHEETGADWDLQIAEDTLYRWFSAALKSAPKASVGVLAQLGDFLHYDSLESITPSSGHILDADSRFQKVVRVVIRATRRVIREMLKRHDAVHVLMAEGNHDIASSIWLREMFQVIYEDEPRVTVDVSPDPYYCYEFGKTSLFFHHGHKRKPSNISEVFAAKFRDVFGRTQHSYAHMGHYHHKDAKENSLMIVEQHRTLAAPDAYASRGGWLSGRSAEVITYHREYGRVAAAEISPEMLK